MIKPRPFFVTGVCLYLILWGSYLLFTSFSYLKDPAVQAYMEQVGLPYALQVVMIYLNVAALLVSAINMLQEHNWARWLYLGWGFIDIDYHLYIAADWHENILPVGIYLITALILLLPSANKYFSNVIEYTDDFND